MSIIWFILKLMILRISNGKVNYPIVVPYPQQIDVQMTQLFIDSNNFKFLTKTKDKCDILEDAIKRYHKISFISDCSLLDPNLMTSKGNKNSNFENKEWLTNLTIEVSSQCTDQWPHLNMDEKYNLLIDSEDYSKQGYIYSKTIWGALRALETFSQLVEHKLGSIFTINSTHVLDFPRFSHRGILIDTSRHFLPIHTILENLDAMAYHKMNVLHWHIVDDQSFPYVSEKFPELSSKGSYNNRTHIYTTEDIKRVVESARLRGIRVIVEFDTPAHSLSWGKGYPKLLTECYSEQKPNGVFGPFNPSLNYTFEFLSSLLEEVVHKFPDHNIHLGGDEVDSHCWETNPEIQKFMKTMKFGDDFVKLQEYYFKRLHEIVSALNKNWILWNDVWDQNIYIPNNTIINVWKSDYQKELSKITKQGFRVILSTPWYLNVISYGDDWVEFYGSDPQEFSGTKWQKDLVIGGQVSIWGEWIDATNFIGTTWPRSMAVAERLWSASALKNATQAKYRFIPNRCRMIDRGLKFQPLIDPKEFNYGFCKCDHKL